MHQLSSTEEVIRALGGNGPVATLCNRDSKTISNWKLRRATFPPSTYLTLQNALAAKGFSAPASLWKMGAPHFAKQDGVAA